jgi:23S rRNA pseudouridine1911/1915/1917 synthase
MTHQRKRYAKARRAPPRAKRVVRDLSIPVERLAFTVSDDESSDRLDHFLVVRLPWRSRRSIVALIETGQVRRNGEPSLRKAGRVVVGDRIEIAVPPPDEPLRHEELGRELLEQVIHEDGDLVAVAKPAGLIVHPVGRVRVNTLIQALHWVYRHGPHRDRDPDVVPRICHRLDRDTSGVLVVAKTMRARVRLQDVFESRDVEKEYVAVLSGVLAQDRGRIDLPIGPDEEAEIDLMMTTRADGQPSRTRYEVIERFRDATFVRLFIETGRQHQIRVHARAIGHPVLLDPLYGDGRLAWPFDAAAVIRRQALHARRCVLPHPRTGEPLVLEAPLPEDMSRLLDGLRRG